MKNSIKKFWICFVMVAGSAIAPVKTHAQVYELERLLLDIEKLLQLKDVLSDLYKGYEILSTGYSAIKNISEGNFNLHKAFLDALLVVSPAVQNYARIADIIDDQASILSEYKSAYNAFKQDKHFTPDELVYISNVYNNLISGSEKNLDNLLNVITADKLRMSDAERLHAIDGIYSDTHDQLMFLRQFNTRTGSLASERAGNENALETVRGLY
jgi:DNA repair ATPase RecN